MLGSQVLDVAIGICFVYLFLSLICTVLNEWAAAIFAMRANNLEDGIRNLLAGTKVTLANPRNQLAGGEQQLHDALYEHPLIQRLSKRTWLDRLRGLLRMPGGRGGPSYLTSRTFALALFDTLAAIQNPHPPAATNVPAIPPGTGAEASPAGGDSPVPAGTVTLTGAQVFQTVEGIERAIGKLPDGDVKEALTALIRDAHGDARKARQSIEDWYNDAMDRVSGLYKRKTQMIVAGLAVGIAVAINADSIAIINSLSHNSAMRDLAVNLAEREVSQATEAKAAGSVQPSADPNAAATGEKNSSAATVPGATPTHQLLDRLKQVEGQLAPLNLPVGWNKANWKDFEDAEWGVKFNKLFGFLLTAVALSMGAPFWFDLLNKFIVVRSTVKPREKSREEKSKDG